MARNIIPNHHSNHVCSMVQCLSEVYPALERSPQDSVLLATPGGVVVCAVSKECAEQALGFLSSGISVLGKTEILNMCIST